MNNEIVLQIVFYGKFVALIIGEAERPSSQGCKERIICAFAIDVWGSDAQIEPIEVIARLRSHDLRHRGDLRACAK